MKSRDIEDKINSLLLDKEKLQAVKFVYDIVRAAENLHGIRDSGLKEAKDSIDAVQGMKNPGKLWLANYKKANIQIYKKFRYINIS